MGNFLRGVVGFIAHPTHSRTMGILVALILVTAVSLTVAVSQQQQQTKQHAGTDYNCTLTLKWNDFGSEPNNVYAVKYLSGPLTTDNPPRGTLTDIRTYTFLNVPYGSYTFEISDEKKYTTIKQTQEADCSQSQQQVSQNVTPTETEESKSDKWICSLLVEWTFNADQLYGGPPYSIKFLSGPKTLTSDPVQDTKIYFNDVPIRGNYSFSICDARANCLRVDSNAISCITRGKPTPTSAPTPTSIPTPTLTTTPTPTNAPTITPTPTITQVFGSALCDSHKDISSCIKDAFNNCKWGVIPNSGSFCTDQFGLNCPAGMSEWYWENTTTNVCAVTALNPTNTSTPALCVTHQYGDANCDGTINLVDFAIWKNESSGKVKTKTADFNNDNAVDMLDYNIWKTSMKGR